MFKGSTINGGLFYRLEFSKRQGIIIPFHFLIL